MKKIRLIIAREYMSIVGRKSFIVTTLLVPLLMMVCMALPILLAQYNNGSSQAVTIAIIDQSGKVAGSLRGNSQYKLVTMRADAGTSVNARALHEKAKNLDAIVVIPANVEQSERVAVYSNETISLSLRNFLTSSIDSAITQQKIASYNIPGLEDIVKDVDVNVDLDQKKWDEDGGETVTSAEVASIIGMVLALVTYMFVLSYGAMIMNSVIEEKTNRIVEVIVSSCRPMQLMMGKIIGMGLVGLTQFAIWAVLLGVISTVASAALGLSSVVAGNPDVMAAATSASAPLSGNAQAIAQAVLSVNYTPILLSFVVYFIGGYLLYASLFAAFGSAVDQASDTSQFSTPLILIMVAALYVGIACMGNPNGQLAVWCSIIPFTSPIVMMVRMPYDVPAWQLLVSVVLLFATAAAMVWLSARIYRTGILLYGKKRSFKEVLHWLKVG